MKILAISDLHGQFPEVPPCDLLIVVGDLCPDIFGGVWARQNPRRQWTWFKEVFIPWAQRRPATQVLVTWGNHDFCGEGRGTPMVFGKVRVVVDDLTEVNGIKIWLTPWSNSFMEWAWMKPQGELAPVYAQIPHNIDILVSHQPPYGCGDVYTVIGEPEKQHIGSSELLYAIEQIQPRAVVCGHLHGGYGTYLVGRTPVYNVSVVDEQYRLVNPATMVTLVPPLLSAITE